MIPRDFLVLNRIPIASLKLSQKIPRIFFKGFPFEVV